jgi:ABC-type nickel/cobalt efflux system permease component RcnA
MTRGQANLLRAFSIWTVYVWVTRMWNIWRDDQSVGFKLVHTVLAVVSVAFAVACWVVVSRVRRRRLATTAPPAANEVDRTPVA